MLHSSIFSPARAHSKNFPNKINYFSSSSSKKLDRNYFIKRLGLEEKDISLPKKFESKLESKIDYWKQNPPSIKEMYGVHDLSKQPIFKGKYINFGLWSNPNAVNFDTNQRIKASESLYRKIAEMACLDKESTVVDVGCGIGFGAEFLMNQYEPKMLVGLDFTPQQIYRAETYHKSALNRFSHERFKFIVGDATKMPFPDNSFSHIVSIEAAQHFPSIEKFIQESCRVLKPEGRLVFTTFFVTSLEGREALETLLPDYRVQCSDVLVEEVTSTLQKNLQRVEVKSIGKQVWPGLENWLKKIGYGKQWTMLWPALYRANYIDYFVFQAELPTCKLIESEEISPSYKPFS
jgi:ubiquinone/menaquinone biosynthesis C-methylase UbiE